MSPYVEAIQFLYSLRWFGTKLGLANTLKLAALAGNPHERLRFIHVAGTNGKGSTCAMLESIYRAAGLRVGLFTSPHLVSFSERIQVNRQPVSESEVVDLVSAMQPLLKSFPADEHPTFFEVITIMALGYFATQRCELVIWETGLGGRLDATNIVTPLASVITNIQFDHQQWLGETLADIAREKAGIIKPDVPVITGTLQPEALQVIQETSRRLLAPLTLVTETEIHRSPLSEVTLPLPGRHQQFNAAVAQATVGVLQDRLPVGDMALRAGLSNVTWPGRLQLLTRPSGQKLLLDGAHNVSGAETLRLAVEDYFPGVQWTLILGILQDKDWLGMCRILAPLAQRILLVPVSSQRTADPEQLQKACRAAHPGIETRACHSLGEAFDLLGDAPFGLVTGSLYLVGETLERLASAAKTELSERELNEWSAQR